MAARDAHRFILITPPPAGRWRTLRQTRQPGRTASPPAGRWLRRPGMRIVLSLSPRRPQGDDDARSAKSRRWERSPGVSWECAWPRGSIRQGRAPRRSGKRARRSGRVLRTAQPPRRPRGSASMSAPATAPGLRRPAARGFCALEARFAPQAVALKGCRALPAASVFERRPAQARGPRRTLYAARVSCYNECVAGLSRDEKLRREPLWMR